MITSRNNLEIIKRAGSRNNIQSFYLIVFFFTFFFLSGCSSGVRESDSRYLSTVQEFADNVLEKGTDVYGNVHTPLLADGIRIADGEPVRWQGKGEDWIISNLASQQNLMRTLVGLSNLTGDSAYKNRAKEIIEYMFENQTDDQGLLYWGGHQFVDLETEENQFKGRPHELKNHFPYYDLMWEVDSVQTNAMLEAMWNAHILNWENLDLNRHGEYNSQKGELWENTFRQPEAFFEGEGLTFINAGTDMVQAAMSLYKHTENEQARKWGMRLYEQYVRARHPETGLGVYQYSQPKQEQVPPEEGPLTGRLQFSDYGDRAKNQFGDTYGDIALEGNILWGRRLHTLYGESAVMYLHLAEQLQNTDAGDSLLTWTLNGLSSFATHSYDSTSNAFSPMWTNGEDLSGDVFPRTGYYGEKGTPFKSLQPTGAITLAFAKAVRLSDGEETLWKVVRSIFIAEGLGDPGKSIASEPDLNLSTTQANPELLAAVLELYKAKDHMQFLRLAERIGDNIIEQHFHDGFFFPGKGYIYASFNRKEPLALLMLEAARRGQSSLVPAYLTGTGYTDGEPAPGGRPSEEHLYELTQ